MSVADKLSEQVSRQDDQPREFREQLERFREFKKMLDKAGVAYGDSYQVPLMARIGHMSEFEAE